MSKVFGGTRLLIRIFTMRRQWHTATLLEAVYGFHRGILDAVARTNRRRHASWANTSSPV
jgi:hypothetical protein